jgi:hypothetical protein
MAAMAADTVVVTPVVAGTGGMAAMAVTEVAVTEVAVTEVTEVAEAEAVAEVAAKG